MRLRLLLLTTLLLAAGCDGGGTDAPPSGGEYIGALQSPHGPEGAAILVLSDPDVQAAAGASVTLFQQPIAGGRRLVLIRDTGGRIEFRVRVAPGAALPSVRVVQVAGADDQMRPSTEGYRVTFTRTRGDE